MIKTQTLEEVVLYKQNSYRNVLNFKELFHSQKYNYKAISGKISGDYDKGNGITTLNGQFVLSSLLIIKEYNIDGHEASPEEEKIVKNIIDISFNTMKIVSKESFDGFYCKKIDDKHWEFTAVKEYEKNILKLNTDDYFNLIIVLNDYGKLQSIESIVISKNYKYNLVIGFSQFRNLIAFENIKFIAEKEGNKYNTNITFFLRNNIFRRNANR